MRFELKKINLRKESVDTRIEKHRHCAQEVTQLQINGVKGISESDVRKLAIFSSVHTISVTDTRDSASLIAGLGLFPLLRNLSFIGPGALDFSLVDKVVWRGLRNFNLRGLDLESTTSCGVTRLEGVSLDSCVGVSDALVSCLVSGHTESLSLNSSGVTGAFIESIKGTNVELFDLYLNNCRELADGVWARLRKIKALRILDASGTTLDNDDLCTVLMTCRAVQEIQAYDTNAFWCRRLYDVAKERSSTCSVSIGRCEEGFAIPEMDSSAFG